MFLVAQTGAAAIFCVDAGKAKVFVQEETQSPCLEPCVAAADLFFPGEWHRHFTSKQIWSIIWQLDGANIWRSFSGVLL